MIAVAAAISPYSNRDNTWKPTMIIPCPSHKARENPRSAALGLGASDVLGVAYHDILRRTDDNPARSATKGKEHPQTVEQMKNQMTIECAAEFTGAESILLVDDTVTHGVTLGNCGLALKAKGAKDIRALTFARTRTVQDLIYNHQQDTGDTVT